MRYQIMSHEDSFSHLPADTAHRFRAVASVLLSESGTLPAQPGLLDVGGYPGTFAREFTQAFPRWKSVTLDRPEEDLPDYVSAGGENIPFDDGQFDAVVSIDTFEHIPPENRSQFLNEMCRVSRGVVVLACPVYHESTAAVEQLYNEAHKSAFSRPHPWLYEHVQYGLPRAVDILGEWPVSHPIKAVHGSYELREWAAYHGLSMLRQVRGEADNAWRGYDEAFAAAPTPKVSEVPYRMLFVATPGTARSLDHTTPAADAGSSAVEMARLFTRLVDAEARAMNAQGAGSGPIIIEQRIKDALRANEQKIDELQAEAVKGKSGGGLLDKIIGRLGK